MASPLGDELQPAAYPHNNMATSAERAAHPNQIALVAFSLACAMFFFIMMAGFVATAHRLEIESLMDRVIELEREGTSDWSAKTQASAEFAESYGGGPPGWMIALVLLYIATGLTWMATIVCGLIGIRRVLRRRMALAALVMAGVIPMLLCFGGLFSTGGM